MKIVILIKVVPDTWGDRTLSLETGLADREASEAVLDEIGERAIEVALAYADAQGDTEIVLLCMGPESAASAVRKGLAMGAESAVHVADEALRGADLGLTAEVLAAALTSVGFDLVITGNQSTDGTAGVIPAMLAERLGVPQLTALTHVTIDAGAVSGERATEGGTVCVSVELPAVISITESLPDARFPSFKGIMLAKKKPYQLLSLADLDVDAARLDVPRAIMTAVAKSPPRGAGVTIVDEGDAGVKLAEFLREKRLVQG